MHLEAMIIQTWMLKSSKFGDKFGGHDGASLEMHLMAVIERIWTITGRQSMDSALDIETLFISQLT
jgi:hypothetical protein